MVTKKNFYRTQFVGPDCKEQEKTIPIRKLLEEE